MTRVESSTDSRLVAFIGPMASGKSAVGEAFAAAAGLPFADTDRIITERHGPIPAIFGSRGERWFRNTEAHTAAELLEGPRPRVVSLGGGAVLDSGTQQLLGPAVVVFLDVDARTVRPRIIRNAGRPLLAGDAVGRWEELYRVRLPVYRKLADVVLDARNRPVGDLVQELLVLLK